MYDSVLMKYPGRQIHRDCRFSVAEATEVIVREKQGLSIGMDFFLSGNKNVLKLIMAEVHKFVNTLKTIEF